MVVFDLLICVFNRSLFIRNIFQFKQYQRNTIHKYQNIRPLVLILGVFFVVINFICLSFMQIHAHFYINYIIYYGLLIFCCQNVAIFPDKL